MLTYQPNLKAQQSNFFFLKWAQETYEWRCKLSYIQATQVQAGNSLDAKQGWVLKAGHPDIPKTNQSRDDQWLWIFH